MKLYLRILPLLAFGVACPLAWDRPDTLRLAGSTHLSGVSTQLKQG